MAPLRTLLLGFEATLLIAASITLPAINVLPHLSSFAAHLSAAASGSAPSSGTGQRRPRQDAFARARFAPCWRHARLFR
jgi:hypothetical protein